MVRVQAMAVVVNILWAAQAAAAEVVKAGASEVAEEAAAVKAVGSFDHCLHQRGTQSRTCPECSLQPDSIYNRAADLWCCIHRATGKYLACTPGPQKGSWHSPWGSGRAPTSCLSSIFVLAWRRSSHPLVVGHNPWGALVEVAAAEEATDKEDNCRRSAGPRGRLTSPCEACSWERCSSGSPKPGCSHLAQVLSGCTHRAT